MAIFYITRLALKNLKRGAVKKTYLHAVDFVQLNSYSDIKICMCVYVCVQICIYCL
jgi:hypothetical protein